MKLFCNKDHGLISGCSIIYYESDNSIFKIIDQLTTYLSYMLHMVQASPWRAAGMVYLLHLVTQPDVNVPSPGSNIPKETGAISKICPSTSVVSLNVQYFSYLNIGIFVFRYIS